MSVSTYWRSILASRCVTDDGTVKDWPRLERHMAVLIPQVRRELRRKMMPRRLSEIRSYLVVYRSRSVGITQAQRLQNFSGDLFYYSDRWGWGRLAAIQQAWNLIKENRP